MEHACQAQVQMIKVLKELKRPLRNDLVTLFISFSLRNSRKIKKKVFFFLCELINGAGIWYDKKALIAQM